MKFCPKCGAILVQKTKNLGCPRCNYSTTEKEKIESSEKIKDHKEIAVIKKEINTAPVTTKKCNKCGNNQAYFWAVQTRAADEAETKFFKCTKCGKTTKEYK
jgi:DNA-directed RNA polymerase subunit M